MALAYEFVEVLVHRFIGEVNLCFIAGIDEVEPAFLVLFDGLLSEDRMVRDLERIRAVLFGSPKFTLFRELEPWITFGFGISAFSAPAKERGQKEENEEGFTHVRCVACARYRR